jgi:hypothetical protein
LLQEDRISLKQTILEPVSGAEAPKCDRASGQNISAMIQTVVAIRQQDPFDIITDPDDE